MEECCKIHITRTLILDSSNASRLNSFVYLVTIFIFNRVLSNVLTASFRLQISGTQSNR